MEAENSVIIHTLLKRREKNNVETTVAGTLNSNFDLLLFHYCDGARQTKTRTLVHPTLVKYSERAAFH